MSYITKPTLPRCYGRISINYLSVINQNHGNLTADFLIKKLKKESTRIPKINWQTAWIAGQCECLKNDLFNAVSDWLRDCLESYRTIVERSKMNNIIHDKFPHLPENCFTRLEDAVTCLVRGVASQYKQAGTPNQPLVQSFTGVLYPTRPDPTRPDPDLPHFFPPFNRTPATLEEGQDNHFLVPTCFTMRRLLAGDVPVSESEINPPWNTIKN